MAVLRKAAVVNQIAQIWSKDLFVQAEDQTFWKRFEGPEGSSMPLIRKDDLEKEDGDTIKIDIALALTGTGQTGDTVLLEGNEEELKMRQFSFSVDSLQHAVRLSKLASILVNKDLRTVARNQLVKWLAGRLDNRVFATYTGMTINGFAPSLTVANLPTTMKWYAGTATSVATVADTDAGGRLKLNDISDIKAYAQVTNKIEPLRLENGEEIFGLVLHPYASLALKKDSQWQQAQREARDRGAGNPLFTGALGMWDGVVLYSANRVPTAADGAGSISVARNIFFGAQAQVRGYAYYPDWTEEEFSYGQEWGVATMTVLGQRLVTFDLNSTETAGDTTDDTAIGSMILYSSAVAPVA